MEMADSIPRTSFGQTNILPVRRSGDRVCALRMSQASPADTSSGRVDRHRFATSSILAIGGAHFVHDVFTGLLAPVLPIIIEKLSLSLTLAGALAVLMQLPSILNPLLGSYVDRHGFTRLLVIVCPGISGTLMLLMGFAPSFITLACLFLVVGFSVAGFHVSGPVLIKRLAANRVGRGMSLFMMGGELARTAAPLVAVQIVSLYGLEGIWRLIPIPIAASAILAVRVERVPTVTGGGTPTGLFEVWKEMKAVLLAVVGILVARSFLIGGLTTFLPTYLHQQGGKPVERKLGASHTPVVRRLWRPGFR